MYVPNEFLCPITLDIMRNPVICEDGISYEKKFIIDWIKKSKTSPITREPMSIEKIYPNESLKNSIKVWILDNNMDVDMDIDMDVNYDLEKNNLSDDLITVSLEPLISDTSNDSNNRNYFVLFLKFIIKLIKKCYCYLICVGLLTGLSIYFYKN